MTNTFQVSKTAAVAILGANLFADETWKSVNYNRKLSSIAVVGSTNVNDFAVDIFSGQRKICTLYNSHGGANVVPVKEDYKYPNALISAGQELQCIVVDAAAGNPVIIELTFQPSKSRFNRMASRARMYNPTWARGTRGYIRRY